MERFYKKLNFYKKSPITPIRPIRRAARAACATASWDRLGRLSGAWDGEAAARLRGSTKAKPKGKVKGKAKGKSAWARTDHSRRRAKRGVGYDFQIKFLIFCILHGIFSSKSIISYLLI